MKCNVMKIFLDKLIAIAKRITPLKIKKLRTNIKVIFSDVQLFSNPTYSEDGLISNHVCDFLRDQKFIESYKFGKAGGALRNHPGDILFRAYIVCWAGKYASTLKGDFVECGVGKALLSRTLVKYLNFDEIKKRFYLFDTFQGIPVQTSGNSFELKNMQFLNKIHFVGDYYNEVRSAFKKYKNVILVKGKIPDSFSRVTLSKIAFASIDMNNAKAEIAAIEYLWPKLVVGGIVILDDYAYGAEFLAQKQALDRFAVKRRINILTLPTGQGLIIKTKINQVKL